MSVEIPIGTLVAIKDNLGGDIGIIVDHHHIRAWPSELDDPGRFKTIYKVNVISKNVYKYCYSYEMVILSE